MSEETKLTTSEKLTCLAIAALGAFTVIGTEAPETSTKKLTEAGYADVKITGKASFFTCLTPMRPTFTAVAANGQKITGYMCGPTALHNPHASIVVQKREAPAR